MTPAEYVRMIAYLIGAALGAFMTVWGIVHSDAALVTSGLALVGVGSTASGALAKQKGKYAR